MASAQNQSSNADLFDVYFRRADLDRDGRISGAEAVAFFQGSGLSQQVLAQIWAIADQRHSGFLGRAEFYNALKLVTVVQSKRDLTPEMVKAALYGPAAAQIPAPKINVTATAGSQLNPTSAAPAPQTGAAIQTSSQNLGFRGPQVPPNVSTNQLQVPSQPSQLIRPPSATSSNGITASRPIQGIATPGIPGRGSVGSPSPNSSISNDWMGGQIGSVQGTPSQTLNGEIRPSTAQFGVGLAIPRPTASLPPRPQASTGIKPSGPQVKDSKTPGFSSNGVASDSFFGGDVFSAAPSPSKQHSPASTFTVGNVNVSSANPPLSAGVQPSVRASGPDALQSSYTSQPVGGHLQQTRSLVRPEQQVATQHPASGSSLGAENFVPNHSQPPWPRMTQTDVQKYTKVFFAVDKDRDGRITGEEARNLFISWRLPREVLKQVWDLSDQDNDSMLSLREFCIALYLMERYREGRPLPAVLPSGIVFDFPNAAQFSTDHSNAAWRPTSGFQQPHGVAGLGAQRTNAAVDVRPPVAADVPEEGGGPQTNQQKSRVPILEKHLVNQLSTEEQNSLNSKFQEATDAEKKVEELEKEILDSREKIVFYRGKMQELVLYKSRCDNRLNEITERVSADKREVESLAKKYEEKYKQAGDVASKLTIEEATFRDIQERKMELYQAIVKMEQDGTGDGILKTRADQIQSDLNELVKTLNERCKDYGLRTKPTTVTELPFGWQPGIQQGAADWNEDWDKFDDEGFTFVKELTVEVQNVLAPPKQKSKLTSNEASKVGSQTITSSSDADAIEEKLHSMDVVAVENGRAYNNRSEEESAKSVPSSPVASSGIGSPKEYRNSNFGKTSGFDSSPHDKDTQSDRGGAGSVFSGDKSFDEPNWGTFDANDDVDSVWGFNAVSTSKESDHERNRENYFFDSGDLGLNPIRTDSSQSGGLFQKKSTFFDESVPSTPLFSSGNSPHGYKDGLDHTFDSFSRFDSFSQHDSGFFASRDTLARFDSMRSSKDFDIGHGFPPSFDDSDPFGSSGPFRTSLESQTPRKGSDNWSAF